MSASAADAARLRGGSGGYCITSAGLLRSLVRCASPLVAYFWAAKAVCGRYGGPTRPAEMWVRDLMVITGFMMRRW